MKRLLLILGLLVGISQAQTTTTITGTIKDLSQALVTSGKVTFTLQPSRDTTISGLARFSPAQVVCLINASGLIKAQDGTSVCTLTMNTALNPPGTYYRVDVWPFNVKTASFTFYAVLSTYDWSTVVPTPTTAPAQNFVDIFSNQTIGGNKTFTGNLTLQGTVLESGAFTASNPCTIGGFVYVSSGGCWTTVQAALVALPSGNGTVYLPGGYSQTITSCISIPANQIAIVGPQYGSAGIIINADSDGFCAPKGTQNIRIENVAISTAAGISLTSNHAAVHLQDAPRPILRNLLISTEATAGGCVLLEGTQTNTAFGPWDGIIENVACQRTTPNQGTADSNLGHFGIWLRGNGGFTNADVSMNLLNKNWVENHGVGLRLTNANANSVTRQHLLLNSINLLIESTSKDNVIVARLNQFRNSGSPVSGTNEHYNIDSTSNDNNLWLKLETPATKGTDASVRDNLMLGATDAWNIGSVVNLLGNLNISGKLLTSQTAPTISSGFGTSPSIVFSNGTAVFQVNVGTGGVATSGVIGLPTATNGWGCLVQDMNTNIVTRATAFTTTSVTLTAASAWTASDKLTVQCEAF